MTIGDIGMADGPRFAGRKVQMFPTLTAAQIARLEAHGKHRTLAQGEILGNRATAIVPCSWCCPAASKWCSPV